MQKEISLYRTESTKQMEQTLRAKVKIHFLVVQYFLVIISCFLDKLFLMRLGHNVQQNSTNTITYNTKPNN